jgi:hypothetical protein
MPSKDKKPQQTPFTNRLSPPKQKVKHEEFLKELEKQELLNQYKETIDKIMH